MSGVISVCPSAGSEGPAGDRLQMLEAAAREAVAGRLLGEWHDAASPPLSPVQSLVSRQFLLHPHDPVAGYERMRGVILPLRCSV